MTSEWLGSFFLTLAKTVPKVAIMF